MEERFPLTEGALRLIMKGGIIEEPIMQVLGSKRIASSSADKERYRLLLSDGKHVISFAMLTTQINDAMRNEELINNTIIKIKKYITSAIGNSGKGNKNVLVILEMDVLLPGDKVGKIGNPEQLPDSDFEQDDSNPSGAFYDCSINNFKRITPSLTSLSSENRFSNRNVNVSLHDQVTYPISSLSPYQNKWIIKARVTNKSELRTWANSRSEGKLFSMDLADESGEIRCTAFRDLADKFFDMIEIDKIYYISKCQVKIANRQFNNLRNDFEMTFTNDTVVQECKETDFSIPQTKYDFISIERIGRMEPGTVVDVIGICKSTTEITTIHAKSTGREVKKREITLVDQTNSAISLTLWGFEAEKFDGSLNPVIAIKGAKVGEFGGGKNLSVFSTSIFKINPNATEAHRLRQWFDHGGKQQNFTDVSARSSNSNFQTQWLSFKEVVNQGLGNSDKFDYYQNKATILLFRAENCVYKACPIEECKRKVLDLENGFYRCDKCNSSFSTFRYRLLGSINLGDWSGNQWISMFATETEKVLGVTSEEVGLALESQPESVLEIAERANFKQFMFKFRVRMETYNDDSRLKTTAIKVEDINYVAYNTFLISKIGELLKDR